jgi:hypothetical protein
MGVVCQVCRTFETFDNSDQDLAQFVELRIFIGCDQFLVPWPHGIEPRTHLTRHLKTLIHLGYRITESLRILEFLSNKAKPSALWSGDTWPDYLSIQSHEILRF